MQGLSSRTKTNVKVEFPKIIPKHNKEQPIKDNTNTINFKNISEFESLISCSPPKSNFFIFRLNDRLKRY